MKKKLFCSFMLSAATILCIFAAGSRETINTITVTGTGTVKIQSDAASIMMSVVTDDIDPAKAAGKNAQIMIDVQNAVSVLGVKKEHISTQNYSLYENYRYSRDGMSEKPEYRASNTITITLTDISLTGVVIDAALQSGANQLSQLTFYSTKTKEAGEEAQRLAIQDAYKKADFLAKGAGRTLGKVVKIEEVNGYSSRSTMYKADMMLAEGGATPVSPEDSTITVSYNFVYELK